MSNNEITGNYATYPGGGICCMGGSASLAGNTISSNSTINSGGGVHCSRSSAAIYDNTISYNNGLNGGGFSCDGGGSPTLEGNRILHNRADVHGGGVFCNDCTSTLTDNEIMDNESSANGGGIYCKECSPMLSGNDIKSNTSSLGGGVFCEYSPAHLEGNFIESNSAGAGGGIYCIRSSLQLTDNQIMLNSVAVGGGIYCLNSSPQLTNNLVALNTASNQGGAIFCREASPVIYSCTLSDNDASSGGAVYCSDSVSRPEIMNCILWGYTSDAIAGYAGGVALTYSDVEGGWSGEGNIDEDPLFVPLDGDGEHTGYYLAHEGAQAAFSPCVDAGTGSVVDFGLEETTTCTDGREDGDDDGDSDTGPIDMGYHYPEGYSGDDNTYIDLVSFTANARDDKIMVRWETGAEIDNAGFAIFRTIGRSRDYEQISRLIPAEGNSSSGASYMFIDENVRRGVTYNYYLVDIETTGEWTAHGPVSARLPLDLGSIELPTANCQPLTKDAR